MTKRARQEVIKDQVYLWEADEELLVKNDDDDHEFKQRWSIIQLFLLLDIHKNRFYTGNRTFNIL